VLMDKKTEAAYKKVFEFLKSKYGIIVRYATTDFEIGMRNAIQSVYPDVQLQGCWFHYCQVRKIHSLRNFNICEQDL
jgi:transposase-like protein